MRKQALDKKLIKAQIRLMSDIEILGSNERSRSIKVVSTQLKRQVLRFLKLSKREAQALLAYYAGALKFETE